MINLVNKSIAHPVHGDGVIQVWVKTKKAWRVKFDSGRVADFPNLNIVKYVLK